MPGTYISIRHFAGMLKLSLHRKLVLIALAALLGQPVCVQAAQLLLCGWDEVFLINTDEAAKGKIEKLWTWRAKDHGELPPDLRGAFGTTDECKPLDGGARVLISSSGGACALVERPSGRVLWYAHVPNAHSLEQLPKERIIAASSGATNGDRLILFDIAKPDQPLWHTPMSCAHGVVWDAGRQQLWALGSGELRSYELKDWETDKPSLRFRASYRLPSDAGHELQAMSKGSDLVVSSAGHVYLFDRETLKFRPHPELGDKADVKCISIHPSTGRVVYLHGEEGQWWSRTLHLLGPAEDIKLPGERLYKGRWLPGP